MTQKLKKPFKSATMDNQEPDRKVFWDIVDEFRQWGRQWDSYDNSVTDKSLRKPPNTDKFIDRLSKKFTVTRKTNPEVSMVSGEWWKDLQGWDNWDKMRDEIIAHFREKDKRREPETKEYDSTTKEEKHQEAIKFLVEEVALWGRAWRWYYRAKQSGEIVPDEPTSIGELLDKLNRRYRRNK